jgi:hypothetical protein
LYPNGLKLNGKHFKLIGDRASHTFNCEMLSKRRQDIVTLTGCQAFRLPFTLIFTRAIEASQQAQGSGPFITPVDGLVFATQHSL